MSIIKYNNKTINKLEHNASEVKKMYYDGDIAYGVDGGSQPTPPTPSFNGKWLATYIGGTTSSAQCDSSSAMTRNEITKTDLQSVEIGDCVTRIGASVFTSATTLSSVTIPDSVTIIDIQAFNGCSSLTSITIPSGVTSIQKYAFLNCRRLTSITINATTPPILVYTDAFDNTNNCPIYVPAASVDAYKTAANWSTYASRIQAIP